MTTIPSPGPAYAHTQRAPLCLIVYGSAIVPFLGTWLTWRQPVAALILAGSGLLVAVLALAFHNLSVVDRGDELYLHFGPLPLFRTTIRYADIQKVEVGRTWILEGWGIHLSLRGGWIWNLWGRDCVVVYRRQGIIRIGSDDVHNLARFLEGKMASS